MDSVPLESLFETVRARSTISLILYFPIGLVLVLLRSLIGINGFILACVLPKNSIRRSLLRIWCNILGITVEVSGEENRKSNVKVLITNHISKLDHLTVNLIYSCVIPSVWDLPTILEWVLGIKELGAKQGKEILIKNTKRYCETSQVPILTHPEGATTNGKKGLLKFGTWPFSLDQPVQPITIQRLGCDEIALTVIGSRWWTDLLWTFFLPVTKFRLKILPVVHKDESETPEEFSKHVQEIIASDLQIAPTNYTCQDKLEFVKKVLFRPGQKSQKNTNQITKIERMSRQVKEVLPTVPLDVIKKDIAKTNSVDVTILHFIEGTITYTPEEAPSASVNIKSPASKISPPVPETAAKAFMKTSEERYLSLQERKQKLIQSARKRYIEKHGLNIPA